MTIDVILELLKNGEWHGLREIAEQAQLEKLKVELITSFLAEYAFLEFDKKHKKIKLSPQLQLFLKKIEELEREEAMGKKRSFIMNLFFL